MVAARLCSDAHEGCRWHRGSETVLVVTKRNETTPRRRWAGRNSFRPRVGHGNHSSGTLSWIDAAFIAIRPDPITHELGVMNQQGGPLSGPPY
jgi:hypothetical protein